MSKWETVKWEDVLTIKNGKNQKKVNNPNGKYPIYGSGGIMGRADDFLCDEGTTVIGRKGSINNPIYVLEKFWNVDTAFGLSPKKGLDRKFFYYFCTTYNFLKHNKATTLPSLTKADLLKIKIALPPLPQQQKIANILDAADALRQNDKELLAKYDELTQALFLEMFGDPFANQNNHSYVKLESLVKTKKDLVDGPFGSSVNTTVDYIENGEIPVIRTKNIGIDNTFKSNDLKFMTREKYETIIRSQVIPGDIVLTKVGTIGNVCIFPDTYNEAVLSTTGSCRIRLNEDIINKKYFLLYLNFYKPKMLEIASAGVQAFLNMKHIKGFDILLPPINLQSQFAERVALIEEQKAIAQASLAKSEELFNSLLQKAFKGELV